MINYNNTLLPQTIGIKYVKIHYRGGGGGTGVSVCVGWGGVCRMKCRTLDTQEETTGRPTDNAKLQMFAQKLILALTELQEYFSEILLFYD